MMKVNEALRLQTHLKALNQTTIYTDDVEGFPWDKVNKVGDGSMWRLNAPSEARFTAEVDGLTFYIDINLELSGSNGSDTHQCNFSGIRKILSKLSGPMQGRFKNFLLLEVAPAVQERLAEVRSAYQTQLEAHDRLTGLILHVGGDDA